jgi:hypothetical protein
MLPCKRAVQLWNAGAKRQNFLPQGKAMPSSECETAEADLSIDGA